MPHRPEHPTPKYPAHSGQPHPMRSPSSPATLYHNHHPMHPMEAAARAGYQHPQQLHPQGRPTYPYAPPPPPPHMAYHIQSMWHHSTDMHYRINHYAAQQQQQQNYHQHHQQQRAVHATQRIEQVQSHGSGERQRKRDSSEIYSQEVATPSSSKSIMTRTHNDSEVEVAVSALMMAATASTSSDFTIQSTPATRCPESIPFKKRKKHLDLMRRNGGEIASTTLARQTPETPCQVSPVSSKSNNDQQLGEEPSSVQTPIVQMSSSCHLDSYDGNNGHALTYSDKIGGTTEIAATSLHRDGTNYSTISNFPSILHSVLTFDVLQWLPHGLAWKIVRWDGLRREILPRFFPQLCHNDEDGNGSGSIDEFLWHVRAWGFCEIKDGSDTGAYSHKHFMRDNPQLCVHMKFWADIGSPLSVQDKDFPSQIPHSLLRVPSLAASRSDGDSKDASSTGDNPTVSPEKPPPWTNYTMPDEDLSSSQTAPTHRGTYSRGSPSMWRPYAAYHPEDPHSVMRHYPSPCSPTYMHNMVSCPPHYDPRYPFRPYLKSTMRPPPHSPQVRTTGLITGVVSSESSHQIGLYPVSMRGKGIRGFRPVTGRAPPQQGNTASPIECATTEENSSQSQKVTLPTNVLGSKRQISNSEGSQIAMAISRKTKMKLPVSRNKVAPSDTEN